MELEPWYKNGLRFKCTGCGGCCTGSDGYVFLSPEDIEAMASHLQCSIETFKKKYTRTVGPKRALIDRPGSAECIFLKNNQCEIYAHRPIQCRTFPWWIHNLRSKQEWERAAQSCEGINHPEAPVIEPTHITKEVTTYLDNVLRQNF